MPSVIHRPRKYKQMALEVAVRNPERYYDILQTFSKFEGKILDDEGILDIYTQLYMDGVVETNRLTIVQQSDPVFMRNYIAKNNTHNNEWGFPTGYQAAFTRYLKTLSEFGFIYSQYNKPFKISPVAKALVTGRITLSEAFALQSLRFWRKNPYRRVLNNFNYFSFVLKAIARLNASERKMSYVQFLVSLFSDEGDVNSYINDITSNTFGNDQEQAYLFVKRKYSEVDEFHSKIAKLESSFRDYGNTVFRVLQLTGFITVEYTGVMLLSINRNRELFMNNLLSQNFSVSDKAMESEEKYYEELGSYPQHLETVVLSFRESENISTMNYNRKIPIILKSYGLNRKILADYLIDVVQRKPDTRAFWFIQTPIKFELLLTLFLYTCYGDLFAYKPNFKCDEAGIPYSHAPGNIGDIEVYNSSKYWLIEATLIRAKNQQLNSETMNLFRHIASDKSKRTYISLIAPYVHEDTLLMIRVGMIITMVEKKRLALYCSAEDVLTFVENGLCENNLSVMEEGSKDFIIQLKNFLNSLPTENSKYKNINDFGDKYVADNINDKKGF